MRIARSILSVRDADRSLAFYTGALGMTLLHRGENRGEKIFRLSYPSAQSPAPAELELRHRPPPPREAAPSDTRLRHGSYWKIGITLCDVDQARARLRYSGVEVSRPAQFEDIGYLCHLADPDGNVIELLQHRFAANHVPSPPKADLALGFPATFGQVSLHVGDATAALRFYRERVGLALVSRQPVPRHRFTLYFLSALAEPAPGQDLEAIANREWLWQRPYTLIELQHHWDKETNAASLAPRAISARGFEGVVVETDAHRAATLRDPDGNRVIIEAATP